jgi:pimeloyl-ACP methyl ester carboxylesterase
MAEGLLRTAEVRVADVRSPVLEAGSPDAGEAVVCVHGNPGSGRDWEAMLGALGAFCRAVALDMPGFGHADKPAAFDYTVNGYARHLGGCLDALGIKRAHLVLHDFGGPWGLEWAVANPGAFATVTLINTGIWVDYRWQAYARVWRTPVLGELSIATVTRRVFRFSIRRSNPRPLPDDFIDRMYDDFDRATRRAVLRLYRATDNPSELGYAQARALRPLRRPALIVWGKHDPYLPLWLAERQREAFPDAHVVVLEDSGHFPFADNSTAVIQEVLRFVRQHYRSDQ